MKNVTGVLVVIFALTGCALSPEQAAQMSKFELCEKTLISNNSTTRDVAHKELEKREGVEECSANARSIRQGHDVRQEKWMNSMAVGLTMMAAEPPAPPPPPPPSMPVVCNARNRGYGNTEIICR